MFDGSLISHWPSKAVHTMNKLYTNSLKCLFQFVNVRTIVDTVEQSFQLDLFRFIVGSESSDMKSSFAITSFL